jgi:hypothetical protein
MRCVNVAGTSVSVIGLGTWQFRPTGGRSAVRRKRLRDATSSVRRRGWHLADDLADGAMDFGLHADLSS